MLFCLVPLSFFLQELATAQQQPDFKQRAQPSFTQGTEGDHTRIVLKSKPTKSVPESSFVSKQLGIATVDVPQNEDMDTTLDKLAEHAGEIKRSLILIL